MQLLGPEGVTGTKRVNREGEATLTHREQGPVKSSPPKTLNSSSYFFRQQALRSFYVGIVQSAEP